MRTEPGYLLTIEPRLVHLDGYADEPGPGGPRPGKQDMVTNLAANGVFTVQPLSADVPDLTIDMLKNWFKQFLRPIYVRDVGANIRGPLQLQDPSLDKGPGDRTVLRGGAPSADNPVIPRSRPSKR